MKELIGRFRRHLVTALFLLVAFLTYALNLKNRDHANPLERGVLGLVSPLAAGSTALSRLTGGVWDDYINLVEVRRENQALKATVKKLNQEVVTAREASAANARLKELLGLKNSLDTPSVAVSVIGEDSSAWFKTMVVNRGSLDGLTEGMPVVATGGVVGRLVRVGPASSRVLLLTDHASAIAAVVQRSRARGVVRGTGGGRCSLEFTVRDEDVKLGDSVVTSGIGGVFPAGLPLGEVTMVKKGEYGVFQTIEVQPKVNIARIEEMLVLLRPPHAE